MPNIQGIAAEREQYMYIDDPVELLGRAMNDLHQFPMDAPATYRIRVQGYPSRSWVEAMWGDVFATNDEQEAPYQTVFIGEIMDQAALVGIINAFYNLGFAILSIENISPVEQAGLDEEM